MQMGMEPSENAAVIAKTRGSGPSHPSEANEAQRAHGKTDGSGCEVGVLCFRTN